MKRIEKLLFFKNAVETLGYFSEQIAEELKKNGYDIWFIDFKNKPKDIQGFQSFVQKKHTAMITFNFIGLSGELEFQNEVGGMLWEDYQMRYFNILVDHPLYYHEKLMDSPEHMTLFCIDRDHVDYVKKYYPGVTVYFLPLAGNTDIEEMGNDRNSTYGEKEDTVAFIANYEYCDFIIFIVY